MNVRICLHYRHCLFGYANFYFCNSHFCLSVKFFCRNKTFQFVCEFYYKNRSALVSKINKARPKVKCKSVMSFIIYLQRYKKFALAKTNEVGELVGFLADFKYLV